MEQLKNNFKRDYELSVNSFNSKDYTSFFRNIRPAIEWLCKLVIYDALGEKKGFSLINGSLSICWRKDIRMYQISEYPPQRNPSGREFCDLAVQSFYCQNTDVTSSRCDEKKKRLKRGLDSYAAEFTRYYSIASELGHHTGETDMQLNIQAISCASFFESYYDFLNSHKVLGSSTISFLQGLKKFTYEDPTMLDSAKAKIESLITELEEKESALLIAQKLQAEAEQHRLEAESRTSEVESQLVALNQKIAELQEMLAQTGTSNIEVTEALAQEPEQTLVTHTSNLKEVMRSVSNGIYIDEETMDDDQLDLIDYTDDQSMLVAGCAGSGKSVIAMHKAKQLQDAGKDVILIAYTMSLKDFMKVGVETNTYRFFHYYQWKKSGMPHADYIIVDEIQDFTSAEIQEFIDATKKCFLFFGDTAQSIYKHYGRATMSIDDIAEMTGLSVLQLYNNYRLPRPVAKITQDYVGVDVPKYKEKVYQNRESELPHIIRTENDSDEFESICNIIKANPDKSIGILYHGNESVLQLNQQLLDCGIKCEFKYNSTGSDGLVRSIGNLDFYSSLPKIMTYHSAKGLQFDIVVIPHFTGANDVESRKSLYVAMTRTMKKLYILYQGIECPSPLNAVPAHLYTKVL